MNIAKKYNLQVIEDCAQSFGATINGKMTGSFGSAGTTSFYPTKNLGAYGDAGMIFTNDDNIADLCKRYREHGSSVRYYHDIIGYNSRLDDIQAAILGVKIEHLDRFNAERRRIATIYREKLGDSVVYQTPQEGGYHIYHQFTIRVGNREDVIKALTENNIASAIFYPVPCHLQKSMAHLGYKAGDLPITDKVSAEVLSLPINPYLTDAEVERIAIVVKSVAKKA
jgi:dTDP-4-amino-4,6-dideoxygalactose transaminase